jgi:hypothetical protein
MLRYFHLAALVMSLLLLFQDVCCAHRLIEGAVCEGNRYAPKLNNKTKNAELRFMDHPLSIECS